jgi:hypothetical protein
MHCASCGHIAPWVAGMSHSCSPSPGGGWSPGVGRHESQDFPDGADTGALFEEINAYLASRKGRYDALVAALIIRSR